MFNTEIWNRKQNLNQWKDKCWGNQETTRSVLWNSTLDHSNLELIGFVVCWNSLSSSSANGNSQLFWRMCRDEFCSPDVFFPQGALFLPWGGRHLPILHPHFSPALSEPTHSQPIRTQQKAKNNVPSKIIQNRAHMIPHIIHRYIHVQLIHNVLVSKLQ